MKMKNLYKKTKLRARTFSKRLNKFRERSYKYGKRLMDSPYVIGPRLTIKDAKKDYI